MYFIFPVHVWQVIGCKIYAEQAPWERMKQGGIEHSHAFILQPSVKRFCSTSQQKGGINCFSSYSVQVTCKLVLAMSTGSIQLHGGLCDMKILKTTKSGFVGMCHYITVHMTVQLSGNRCYCYRVCQG